MTLIFSFDIADHEEYEFNICKKEKYICKIKIIAPIVSFKPLIAKTINFLQLALPEVDIAQAEYSLQQYPTICLKKDLEAMCQEALETFNVDTIVSTVYAHIKKYGSGPDFNILTSKGKNKINNYIISVCNKQFSLIILEAVCARLRSKCTDCLVP